MPSRALRVVHVMPLMDPAYGGPTEATDRLCRALHDEGVEVSVLTTDRSFLTDEPFRLLPDATPYPVSQFPIARPSSWSRSPALAEAIAEEASRADLVHTHTIYHHSTTVTARVGRRTGTPVVMEPHGSLTRYSRSQKRVKKAPHERVFDFPALRRAAGVRCASTAELDDLAELGLADRAFVVPHGVDPLPAASAGAGHDAASNTQPTVLFLGRLAAKKRLDLTVEAFAVAHSLVPTARLRIVGAGEPEIEAITRSLIETHGLTDVVEMVGPRFDHERTAEFLQASAFVLLSDDESFGMAPLEALCAGLPVVATPAVSSMRDLDGTAEVHLVDQDVERAGHALAQVLEDTESKVRARRQAPELGAEYSWRSIARQMIEQYRGIIDGDAGR